MTFLHQAFFFPCCPLGKKVVCYGYHIMLKECLYNVLCI